MYAHACVHVYAYVHVCVHVCMFGCMYVYVFVRVYLYVYVRVHFFILCLCVSLFFAIWLSCLVFIFVVYSSACLLAPFGLWVYLLGIIGCVERFWGQSKCLQFQGLGLSEFRHLAPLQRSSGACKNSSDEDLFVGVVFLVPACTAG